MILIFGLGNPGKKYEFTRHNIGARTVKKLELLGLENVLLVEPTTFMNESGKAVKFLMRKHGVRAANLVVIHDDLDIALGKIKIVKNRGAAGHKGVESIIKELGTPKESLPIPSPLASYGAGRLPTGQAKNFVRFRVGICPKTGKPKNVEKFVLQKFSKREEEIIEKVIEKTCQAIEMALKKGIEKAMAEFNC